MGAFLVYIPRVYSHRASLIAHTVEGVGGGEGVKIEHGRTKVTKWPPRVTVDGNCRNMVANVSLSIGCLFRNVIWTLYTIVFSWKFVTQPSFSSARKMIFGRFRAISSSEFSRHFENGNRERDVTGSTQPDWLLRLFHRHDTAEASGTVALKEESTRGKPPPIVPIWRNYIPTPLGDQ